MLNEIIISELILAEIIIKKVPILYYSNWIRFIVYFLYTYSNFYILIYIKYFYMLTRYPLYIYQFFQNLTLLLL